MRESPALDILALLAKRGAVLSYSDPLVPRLNLDELELCSEPMEEGAKNADCVVIVTDHSSVDYPRLLESSQLIVDTRNRLKGIHSPKIKRL